jgi:hypothetical protein
MGEIRQKMRSENYVHEAIVQLLGLKLRTGSSTVELKKFVESCLDDASQMSKGFSRGQGLDIHRLGSVLRAWHTETSYLTREGLPRALSATGRGGLRGLIRKFYAPSKFQPVFKRLREARLIRRSGRDRWLPTGRHARISQLSYETLEHLSEGVARYVETVVRNVTSKRSTDVLFERSCKVTRLPTKQFGEFRDYVSQQANAFLTAVDDWLESRNVPQDDRHTKVHTAGVYTFAYADRNS